MNKSVQQAVFFCWLVLFSLFFLKLWYTILWVILFALVMTFVQKKRSYCAHVCPIGYIQDRMYRPRNSEERKPANPSLLKKIIFLVFWLYLLLNIALFSNQTGILWLNLLQLMVFSLLTALLLQHFYRKRYWCSHACPVGSVLTGVVKFQHRRSSGN
ncbi:4Fe-4S binding protein [Paradesulfitobacterium ferrireducens]|uniref:4Fe-4S binding protein n=1 Tax=Paradesulfitobacterium ferrireducens TaxID=2816476 RepID=UPI001A8FE7FB|nr:4Fe-4S binding protein [Paradesulfitobacterium ferrireducens]